ncbi:DUF262 domain-containing protein [Flavobacterium ajazii]|uniref:DUF262 domain-containing protein n=1 Tax=Flavobacterium ajazii TaxID=2692318 RepID=UPI0013CFE12C|nr:DUF262 domain-containing protein [Flavobacterium ajazii]
MNSDIETSKTMSFWQLLQLHKVEIPIIQRDYAQGREDKSEIRQRFLNTIFNALSLNKPLELDFIYGSVIDNCMQPLDGQQRLTTLFLLHWYIACKENKMADKVLLENFTYETRTSSREFCIELVQKGINFVNLLETDYDKNGIPKNNQFSKTIIDSSWFFLSWKKDPTIKAMLFMLDAIHQKATDKKFENIKDFWRKFTEDHSITFNYIELKDFGLSDDLYIKMNARGKPLTDFENFKASFENKIKIEFWEEKITNPTEKFTHKIDTIWADLFWTVKDGENLTDSPSIKIISSILLSCLALSEKEKDAKERRIRQILNQPNVIQPEDFDFNSFCYLKEALDGYSSVKDKIQFNFNLWSYSDNEINFFDTIAKGDKIEYQKIVLFYAQTQYLLNNGEIDSTNFSDWIRVARNIVVNSTIDSAETFTGAIRLINELSIGSKGIGIYKYISENSIKSEFAKDQVKEEVTKSKIICFNDSYKEIIFKTEDTNFCKGRITIALDSIAFDKNNIESFSSEKLSKIEKVLDHYLSDDNDVSNDFRRGLFTIDDNHFYNYWDTSWLYAVDAPKRCMIGSIYDLKSFAYKANFRKYLIGLLQQLTEKGLDEIIEGYEIPIDMPNWKIRLIKEKGLLDYSNKHYIAIKEDECCWLIPESKVANNKEGAKKCKLIK